MKTALVTGGARRIGKSIVIDLAKNGYNVAFQYTNSDDEADSLTNELEGITVKTAAFKADLTQRGSAQKLFAEAKEEFGQIDLLINNASIFKNDSVEAIDEKLWDAHFAIHLKKPALLASAMAAQEHLQNGLIVNIIDQRVWRPNPNFFSYTLSKSALWTATQTMAQALAPRIRVNAIGPGPTLANERQEASDFQKQIDALPMKQGPSLDEFGSTIRYLDNTPSITGQMIALDGGQHLAWETPDIVGIKE